MATAAEQFNLLLQDAELDALLAQPLDDLQWLPGPDDIALDALPLMGDDLSPTHVLGGPAQPISSSSTDDNNGTAKRATKKGTNVVDPDEEAKKERVRAKNRRAQNKYRQKQKDRFKGTEQQVEEMSAEVERLRMENERMAHQHSVLEKVLEVRDSAVGMLEAGKASSAGVRQLQPPAVPRAVPPVEEVAGADDRAGGEREREAGGALDCKELCVFAEKSSCARMREERAHTIDVAAIANTPPEEVIEQWKDIVQRLSDVMAANARLGGQAEGGGDGAISAVLESHVHPILTEASMVCFEHALYNPTNIQLLLARSLDDGKSGQSAENQAKWAAVVSALGLRPKQVQQMAAYREVFLRRICRVMQERRAIFDRLGELNTPEGLQAMRGTTELWLKTHGCTQDLSANIKEEQRVGMEFLAQVVGGLLDDTQKAKVIVHSWPFFPDVFSISTAALALEGRSQQQLLEGCSACDCPSDPAVAQG